MKSKNAIYLGSSTSILESFSKQDSFELVNFSELEGYDKISKEVDRSSVLLIDEGIFFKSEEGHRISDLKKNRPFLPVIVVSTASSSMTGRALAEGAVDFVRPDQSDLVDRISFRCDEVENRRQGERVEMGDLVIDTYKRKITGSKGEKLLSPTEMNLLKTLALAKGHVVDRTIIKRECWGSEEKVSDNALNRKLHEVRRAVKEVSASASIKTVYGHGFKLDVKSHK